MRACVRACVHMYVYMFVYVSMRERGGRKREGERAVVRVFEALLFQNVH